MIETFIVLLALLWAFGYIHIGGINFPDVQLFIINGREISLLHLLVFFIVMWAISILPTPFREISGALLFLWVLAILGIISLTGIGLPSIFVFAIIVGLIASLFSDSQPVSEF